ncbi:MAG: cell division protein FtsL [Xanthomonadales bacterium]|nr:cell division protein FtsL [Xanthomonadales bacterium]
MRRIRLTLLIAAVLASGVATVFTRHQGRQTFVELQKLEETRDALNIEWGRLQLEQATWAQSGRVEEKARVELGLVSKEPSQVMVIVR